MLAALLLMRIRKQVDLDLESVDVVHTVPVLPPSDLSSQMLWQLPEQLCVILRFSLMDPHLDSNEAALYAVGYQQVWLSAGMAVSRYG